MAVTAYSRLRLLWGAYDLVQGQATTPNYATTQFVTGGTSAVAGSGIGVRRASLIIDRQTLLPGADNAMMHFDFLNWTGGNPDDTWITSDYTTLEGLLQTFWTTCASSIIGSHKLTQIVWHRVGSGVTKPNPAERVMTLGTPLTSSGGSGEIPQTACSITFRTGVRRSWGRTYLPFASSGNLTTQAYINSTAVDVIAGAANALVTNAAASDFSLVVVSSHLNSALAVESIEVDNVADVIRRRRWKKSTYKKVLP